LPMAATGTVRHERIGGASSSAAKRVQIAPLRARRRKSCALDRPKL
jgi:hypothetical protein